MRRVRVEACEIPGEVVERGPQVADDFPYQMRKPLGHRLWDDSAPDMIASIGLDLTDDSIRAFGNVGADFVCEAPYLLVRPIETTPWATDWIESHPSRGQHG